MSDGEGEKSAAPRESLSAKLAGLLRAAIRSGEFPPGGKLPSEAMLTKQYDVSRSVVREAVAALRSDGLVEARQGAGVFVLASAPGRAGGLHLADPEKLSSMLEMLELRAAIEEGAAALAAQRRSPAQEEAIWEALTAEDGPEAAPGAADFAFHLAVARAANNPRFVQFLEMSGAEAIPRARLKQADDAEYRALLRAEHERIAGAISARDEAGAREAMRAHLEGGQARYRRMMRGG